MRLAEFLQAESVIAALSGRTKSEVLRELSRALESAAPGVSQEQLYRVLSERERECSTGVGEGVAIPHGKLAGLPGLVAAFGVAPQGIDFEALDQKPTFLFFTLVAPENCAGAHLKALARISRLFKQPAFRASILNAKSGPEMYELIVSEDSRP
jgi:PTS system nitrogen regulatory IIA component